MSAARARWRLERSRMRAVLSALRRDDLASALGLLAEAELDAFERDEGQLAGEVAYAHYLLGCGDPTGAAVTVERLLERRYG